MAKTSPCDMRRYFTPAMDRGEKTVTAENKKKNQTSYNKIIITTTKIFGSCVFIVGSFVPATRIAISRRLLSSDR